jgi:3'-phosphoadenosine 5'-phosphosulfate sulfotransferase (PAPS reductase)/FAD synthetase
MIPDTFDGYDMIVVSVSGGKDSQACLSLVAMACRERKFKGHLVAVHADTGAEWNETEPHCRLLADAEGVELAVVRNKVLLPEKIAARCRKLEPGKGGWPSPACRYCTSDCKRDPIHTWVRQSKARNILMVTGERKEESPHRAKLAPGGRVERLCAAGRVVEGWRPLLEYKEPEVWKAIGVTGHPVHVAYSLGNDRLSCAMCVLASEGDIRRGAEARPDLAKLYLDIEVSTKHTFRAKKSLEQILEG